MSRPRSLSLAHSFLHQTSLVLTRTNPLADPEAVQKQLFSRAKRRVLAILKVHHGSDLEAVLAQQVTEDDEDLWARLVDEEDEEEQRQAQAQRRPVVAQLDDIRKCVSAFSFPSSRPSRLDLTQGSSSHSMSFQELKMATLSDILELRKTGLVSKNDKYQAILNALARDIRSKRASPPSLSLFELPSLEHA